MLLESDLVVSRSLDTKSRLEKARSNYESLLLHAGPNLVLSETPDTTQRFPHTLASPEQLTSSNLGDSGRLNDSFEQDLRGSRTFATPNRFLASPPVDQDRTPFAHLESEANDTIIILQEENDRLKGQLEFLMESTEQLIQEAQATNKDIINNYEMRLAALESRNRILEASNQQLTDSLSHTQTQLAADRDQLKKAMQIIDRYQRRSRDYLEVQRKGINILKNVDGLHYTGHMRNETLQTLHKQQQMEPLPLPEEAYFEEDDHAN